MAGTDYITSGQAHGNSKPTYNFPTRASPPATHHSSPHPSGPRVMNPQLNLPSTPPAGNQILSVLKLIHLATLLDRVPILASLSGAAHNEGPPIPLSTFYNLTHLSRKVGQPLLEWHQVKDPSLGPAEPLGCWRTVPRGGGEPALTQSGLIPEYWAIPPQLGTTTYRSLVQLSTDTQLTTDWVASERHRLAVAGEDAPEAEPDGHLLCFDQHLRTWEQTRVDGTKIEKEALQDLNPLGPAWALVGQHLRWNEHFAALADQVKADLLSSASQPYLAVHLRQGDFIQQRRTQPGLIEPFVDGVAAVQARLAARKGAGWAALPVVFATDSEDEDYLDQLKKLGWLHLDHARWRTTERLGGWYPAHLDLAVLSGASGFVGYVSRPRCEARHSRWSTEHSLVYILDPG